MVLTRLVRMLAWYLSKHSRYSNETCTACKSFKKVNLVAVTCQL